MFIGGNFYLIDVVEVVFNGFFCDFVLDLVFFFEGFLMLYDDEFQVVDF